MLLLLICIGFFISGSVSTALSGLQKIVINPGRLLNDFTAIEQGAALINASLVAAIGLMCVYFTHIQLSGPTFAAIFTMFGFGLFGKTPFNIIPILLGVFITAKFMHKAFREYVLIGLFGTALGPVVSFIIFEIGIHGTSAYLFGIAAGITAGLFLPPIAMAMLHLHQGYNLYNMGLTSGFIGLFAAALLSAAGFSLDIKVLWNTVPDQFYVWFIPALSGLLLLSGLIGGKLKTPNPKRPKPWFSQLIYEYKRILRSPGRLPSDFFDIGSVNATFVHMGLLGLISWLYVVLTGGVCNGPIVGGMLTVMGFGAFGKHIKNIPPVMLGVFIACLVFGKNPAAPGPLLAALFVTTLAPISGQFGPHVGCIAGFLHLVLVERTAAWHGGLDLYNNGFAGGLTAAFIVAIIEWYRTNAPEKKS